MKRDPTTRLGAKRDAEEIKTHDFFRGTNWDSVLKRQLKPPIPDIKIVKQDSIDPLKVYGDLSIGEKANAISGWSFVSA